MRHHGVLAYSPNPEVTQDVARVRSEACTVGEAKSINDCQVTFENNRSGEKLIQLTACT